MQPALFRFDRHRTGSVFGFGNGVILPQAGHTFFFNHRMGDVLCQSEPDTAAGTSFNEAVHRSGIKRILPVYEFRKQADVPLLGALLGHQIRQAFPRVQILGADNACCRHCRRQVGRVFGTGFGAEHAVDPTVLVLSQPHVIDIGFVRIQIRQHNRLFPKAKIVDAVGALCNRKEAFSVIALYPNHKTILAIQINCSGVEHRVDSQPFQKKRVRFRIQIVPPVQRHMVTGEHRIFPPQVDTIIKRRFLIFAAEQFFLLLFLPQIFNMIHLDSSL